MRHFFRQSYSTTYHQQTQSLPADQATAEYIFDTLDIKGQGHGITELAAALAQSPSFATAWTQKLCQFANSSSCADEDKEFQRVAGVFLRQQASTSKTRWSASSSRRRWSTGAGDADRNPARRGDVGVSRREHSGRGCRAAWASPMPAGARPTAGSGWTRTAFGIPGEAPTAAVRPAPFSARSGIYFSTRAVENLCAQLATQVIDPVKPCPKGRAARAQTTAGQQRRRFPEHRHGAVASRRAGGGYRPILTVAIARPTRPRVAATAALQSTFTLACASPLSEASGL